MRLSLWMILDYLLEYNPTAYINDGKPEISMSRILSSELHPGGSILYLAKSEDYFGFPENKVLCVHNRDYLLLAIEAFLALAVSFLSSSSTSLNGFFVWLMGLYLFGEESGKFLSCFFGKEDFRKEEAYFLGHFAPKG